MRLIVFTTIGICVSTIQFAQKNNSTKVNEVKCTGFAISRPLSELQLTPEEEAIEDNKHHEVKKRTHSKFVKGKQFQPEIIDPIAQTNGGNKQMMPPIVNFDGVPAPGSFPPDPSGAVSANYFFQAVNTKYRIFNKTGGSVSASINLNALWAGSTNDGDPIVLYDKYADRWFMSQFNDPDKLLVAVSTSSNPLGTYFTYTFVPNAGVFPDYPKYSIWSDGYYFSTNIGEPFKVGAIDRTKILAGNPAATMISLDLPTTPNVGFFGPLAADADGTLPPNGTPCPLFAHIDDTWGVAADQLRIFNISLDWNTPANSTVLLNQTLSPASFNVSFTAGWDDIPQPGSTQKLDAIDGVLMFKAQYRRWVGYNTVVLTHAVIVNPTTKQTGIRWYELRQNTATNVWSIFQQGTYAPDANYRWMGSAAMDDNGSIGLAYAVSSSTVSPSLRYTGRNANDPLGIMTFTETLAVAGSGAQAGANRFGDYAQTSLDPSDGITFWHTGEYIRASSQRTRIFSFQIPSVSTGVNEEFVKPDLLLFKNENSINVKGIRLPNNEITQVDLFDINGKEISTQQVTPSNNSFETTVPFNNLNSGIYIVRVGNESYQKIKKIIIN